MTGEATLVSSLASTGRTLRPMSGARVPSAGAAAGRHTTARPARSCRSRRGPRSARAWPPTPPGAGPVRAAAPIPGGWRADGVSPPGAARPARRPAVPAVPHPVRPLAPRARLGPSSSPHPLHWQVRVARIVPSTRCRAGSARFPGAWKLTLTGLRERSRAGTVYRLAPGGDREHSPGAGGAVLARIRWTWLDQFPAIKESRVMSDLIAIGYPDETTALQAADEARRLAADLIIQPDAIAAIVRDKDGKFHTHTSQHHV